ncbi:hypothetical protein [Actinoallomurus sp. CA-142502]|uniref:hypothetical protein n=1 Tax=Actinoallomurus sp. CA-142502 TaxID=3239885 RepID=UPI003D91FA25
MLVRLAKTPHHRPTKVRVHSSVGHAVVLWGGDPEEAEGRHNVEWSVDEDIRWGHNTQPAALAKPGFWQHGDQVVMRGRVHFTEDGAAVLEMGDSQILFNLAAPPPESIDRAWVEISAEADKITLWPFRL